MSQNDIYVFLKRKRKPLTALEIKVNFPEVNIGSINSNLLKLKRSGELLVSLKRIEGKSRKIMAYQLRR